MPLLCVPFVCVCVWFSFHPPPPLPEHTWAQSVLWWSGGGDNRAESAGTGSSTPVRSALSSPFSPLSRAGLVFSLHARCWALGFCRFSSLCSFGLERWFSYSSLCFRISFPLGSLEGGVGRDDPPAWLIWHLPIFCSFWPGSSTLFCLFLVFFFGNYWIKLV